MKTIHTNRYRRVINLIVAARKRAKLTQEDVGTRLGRSQSHVASIESGGRRLDIVELVDLCAIVKLDPVEVIKEVISTPES
ncbi:helix-turn-helix domain-containing protein [Microvirga flavescens]|uniref:helix-turn-helix domain-containing protein n=1 Tax=Microvirga flavescens TaxID=2249811 RepID=UPI000DD695AA